MSFDPEILKELCATFKIELEEQGEIIARELLALEKNNLTSEQKEEKLSTILRCAHNIKGTARSLGIQNIGEVAHHIETIFSRIQNENTIISKEIIDICLQSIDEMQLALQAFVEETPFNFTHLNRLSGSENQDTQSNKEKKQPETPHKRRKSDEVNKMDFQESIRINIENIDKISALMEDMQINKIGLDEDYAQIHSLGAHTLQFAKIWQKILRDTHFANTSETFKNHSEHQVLLENGADEFTHMNNIIYNLQKKMRNEMNDLSLLNNLLQEEIRTLRLIPAENLLKNIPRYIRDLSHDLHKKVNVVITGAEVKMDKMVLESLHDPLNHLVRNCVDHGIEAPETRLALGKPEVGEIHIDIKEEGGQVFITVSDDGAGINVAKVAEVALQKSFLTQAELVTMSEADILDLIFLPGFTSKEIITQLSGRGVGLDVVKSNLLHLNGSVKVHTVLGKGTTFVLCVPLTLTSERGLMVLSAEQFFVLPVNALQRVLELKQEDLVIVEGTEAVLIDEYPIPLRNLANILDLGQPTVSQRDRLTIVILNKNNKTVALLVDSIIGEREIVIKPLYAPLKNVPCVAGGTLSGNNQVIPVLDPSAIMNRALQMGKHSALNFQEKTAPIVKKPHILVVDDSITTRTLEKNILESKQYVVTIAVNGQEAWDLLQKQEFSLLITDVVMPIMDGFTLTDKVKKSDKLRDLPVIIVTSLGSENEKKRGIEVGADAYVVKNEFESGALLEIVEQLV